MTFRATVHGDDAVSGATPDRVLAGVSGLLASRASALFPGQHASRIEP